MDNKIELNGLSYEISGNDTVTVNRLHRLYSESYISGPLQEIVEISGKQYRLTSIGLLYRCVNIIVPSSVTSIGELLYCNNITIPSSVTSLGVMSSCKNMKIDFPKGITALGKISGVDGISIPDTVTSIKGLNNCSGITIPSSVRSIGELSHCKDITIPSSVILGVMRSCSNMRINFAKGITTLGEISGVDGISIPDTVNSIKRLDNCTCITIPSSVTSIGELSHCKDIIIPSSVMSIGGLSDMEDFVIPSTVTSIGRLSSYDSTLIVTIPSTVLTISEINGEKSTMVLRMESKTPPVVGKIIKMVKADQLLVPQGSLDAYKNDPLWGKFKTIREDPTLGETTAAPAPTKQPKEQTPTPAKQPSKKPTEQTPAAKQPTEAEMKALDRLIDAALEDFVVTDEERATLLKKADSIGLSRDEFKMILDSRIQRRMKEKPEEKIEEKKKGFFARLFGK